MDEASKKLDVGAHSRMFEVIVGVTTARAGVLDGLQVSNCTVTEAIWGRPASGEAVRREAL